MDDLVTTYRARLRAAIDQGKYRWANTSDAAIDRHIAHLVATIAAGRAVRENPVWHSLVTERRLGPRTLRKWAKQEATR